MSITINDLTKLPKPCMCGLYDAKTGRWYPNPRLEMSIEHQHNHNLFAGYSCRHMLLSELCPICNDVPPWVDWSKGG